MSRAMNLRLTLDDVVKRCGAAGVSISAIEPLPSGHTHLVCTTSDGANEICALLKNHLIETREKRFPFVTVRPSRT